MVEEEDDDSTLEKVDDSNLDAAQLGRDVPVPQGRQVAPGSGQLALGQVTMEQLKLKLAITNSEASKHPSLEIKEF